MILNPLRKDEFWYYITKSQNFPWSIICQLENNPSNLSSSSWIFWIHYWYGWQNDSQCVKMRAIDAFRYTTSHLECFPHFSGGKIQGFEIDGVFCRWVINHYSVMYVMTSVVMLLLAQPYNQCHECFQTKRIIIFLDQPSNLPSNHLVCYYLGL